MGSLDLSLDEFQLVVDARKSKIAKELVNTIEETAKSIVEDFNHSDAMKGLLEARNGLAGLAKNCDDALKYFKDLESKFEETK